MESASYRRLNIRFVAVPMIALAVLAALLAYGLNEVLRSARRVDQADQVIALANNLVKLMVDQETSLRGFLLTRDQGFLQPYREAEQQLEPQFSAMLQFIRKDAQQTAILNELQAESRVWQQLARSSIARPELSSGLPMMLERKQKMGELRAIADKVLSAETAIRASRASVAVEVDILSFHWVDLRRLDDRLFPRRAKVPALAKGFDNG